MPPPLLKQPSQSGDIESGAPVRPGWGEGCGHTHTMTMLPALLEPTALIGGAEGASLGPMTTGEAPEAAQLRPSFLEELLHQTNSLPDAIPSLADEGNPIGPGNGPPIAFLDREDSGTPNQSTRMRVPTLPTCRAGERDQGPGGRAAPAITMDQGTCDPCIVLRSAAAPVTAATSAAGVRTEDTPEGADAPTPARPHQRSVLPPQAEEVPDWPGLAVGRPGQARPEPDARDRSAPERPLGRAPAKGNGDRASSLGPTVLPVISEAGARSGVGDLPAPPGRTATGEEGRLLAHPEPGPELGWGAPSPSAPPTGPSRPAAAPARPPEAGPFLPPPARAEGGETSSARAPLLVEAAGQGAAAGPTALPASDPQTAPDPAPRAEAATQFPGFLVRLWGTRDDGRGPAGAGDSGRVTDGPWAEAEMLSARVTVSTATPGPDGSDGSAAGPEAGVRRGSADGREGARSPVSHARPGLVAQPAGNHPEPSPAEQTGPAGFEAPGNAQTHPDQGRAEPTPSEERVSPDRTDRPVSPVREHGERRARLSVSSRGVEPQLADSTIGLASSRSGVASLPGGSEGLVDRPDLMDQIGSAARAAGQVGGLPDAAMPRCSRVRIHLRPPELGVVHLLLESRDGQLSAHFHATDVRVQGWLQANADALRAHLTESGVNLHELTLSAPGHQGGGHGGTLQPQDWQPRGESLRSPEGPGAGRAAEPLQARMDSLLDRSATMVDWFA